MVGGRNLLVAGEMGGRMAKVGALLFAAGAGITLAFHLAMILGAPWGHLTMGGRWEGALPLAARGLSAASAALTILMALVVAAKAGLLNWRFPVWAFRAVLVLMALSVVLHLATPSRAERRLWLPVILAMAAGTIAVAWGRR
jgi:hypothetical protein